MDLRTVLEYSPYDNKRITPFDTSSKEKNKKEFIDNFFVDYSKYTKETLDMSLYKTIKGIKNTILFYGASGSGKTTYLNYFADTYLNDFVFHFINLIEDPTPTNHERCIKDSILAKLSIILDDKDNGVTENLYRRFVVGDAVMPFERNEDNDLFVDYLVETLQRWKKAEKYLYSIGSLDDEEDHLAANCNEGLLMIYVISELLKSDKNLNGEKKHVFIFDNLDEVPTQYITSHTFNLILSVYSKVQRYCMDYSDYNFLRNCTFILSYRSTNAQLIDEAQHEERVFMATEDIEFGKEYQVQYSDILNRRMEYYWKHEADSIMKDSIINACILFNTEKGFCSNVLRPLFNYDYRMFTTLFILHLFGKDFKNIDKRIIIANSDVTRFDSVEQTGARGVLLFNALESMMSYHSSRFMNYVRHEFEDETICNIYRMAFTLLSNLGGWSIKDMDLQNAIRDENVFNEGIPRITMGKFVKRIEKWYGAELVSTVLEGLVGSVAYNYEYPVVLEGSKVDSYYDYPSNPHTTSGLASYIEKLYNENEGVLSSIYVKINPLCVLYAWRVFINFEYFNLISTKWDCDTIKKSRYKPVPLFQINTEYELRQCLNSVFLTVNYVLSMADRHFCDKCFDLKKSKCKYKKGWGMMKKADVNSSILTCKESFNDFIEDGFCVQNSLYATRLITSHINYLERYRKYMKTACSENLEKSIIIQRVVIDQMSEYIRLWGERRVVTTSKDLHNDYLSIVKNALDNEHIDSAESYNNISMMYYNQGDYDEALTYQFRVLEIHKKTLGLSHPETATTYNSIADAFKAMNKYPEALEYYYKAMKIRETMLGEDHINTATTYNNIGSVYYNQGDFAKALEFFNKAYSIRNNVLGADHFETIGTLDTIIMLNKLLPSLKT